MFLPFQPPGWPPARREAAPAGRKANSIIPLRGKAFTHLLIPRPFFPLKRNGVFSASSGSREKNQVNPVNPVRKHFGFMSR